MVPKVAPEVVLVPATVEGLLSCNCKLSPINVKTTEEARNEWFTSTSDNQMVKRHTLAPAAVFL